MMYQEKENMLRKDVTNDVIYLIRVSVFNPFTEADWDMGIVIPKDIYEYIAVQLPDINEFQPTYKPDPVLIEIKAFNLETKEEILITDKLFKYDEL